MPVQAPLRLGDVGSSNPRVIGREGLMDNFRSLSCDRQDFLGKVQNGKFVGIAEVDRLVLPGKKELVDPFH